MYACDLMFTSPFARCNNKPDCPDKLDESNVGDVCAMIEFPEGHRKDEIPRRFSNDDLLQVNITMVVVSFLELNEMGQTLKATFNLRSKWFDGQLTFRHLQRDTDLNFLWPTTYAELWRPIMIFENIDPSKDHHERRLRYTVRRNLTMLPIVRNPGTANASNVFNGSDHRIERSKEYTYSWRCVYHLKWFPFDHQTCNMELTFPKFYRDFVRLNPEGVEYLGDKEEMTEYSVDKMLFCSKGNGTRLVLVVTLGRPLLGSVLTTFLPTLLLFIIRFRKRFKKPL